MNGIGITELNTWEIDPALRYRRCPLLLDSAEKNTLPKRRIALPTDSGPHVMQGHRELTTSLFGKQSGLTAEWQQQAGYAVIWRLI